MSRTFPRGYRFPTIPLFVRDVRPAPGEVPEWPNGADSKSAVPSGGPGVRIPPSPPYRIFISAATRIIGKLTRPGVGGVTIRAEEALGASAQRPPMAAMRKFAAAIARNKGIKAPVSYTKSAAVCRAFLDRHAPGRGPRAGLAVVVRNAADAALAVATIRSGRGGARARAHGAWSGGKTACGGRDARRGCESTRPATGALPRPVH